MHRRELGKTSPKQCWSNNQIANNNLANQASRLIGQVPSVENRGPGVALAPPNAHISGRPNLPININI